MYNKHAFHFIIKGYSSPYNLFVIFIRGNYSVPLNAKYNRAPKTITLLARRRE